jgi:hypothetical protein
VWQVEGAPVDVTSKNVGVSNGVLYLMSDTGNVAVFAKDQWLRVQRLEDE